MKAMRAVALGVCFALFVGLTLWQQDKLTKDVNFMLLKADEIESSLEQREQALALCIELDEYWEKKLPWWSSSIPHNELMEVTVEVKNLGVAIRVGNTDDAVLAVSNMRLYMSHLVERNSLRLDHVL